MKRHIRAIFACFLLVALIGGAFATYRYFNRTATIKIAVESLESEEGQLLTQFSQWLTSEKRFYRITLVPYDKKNPQDLLKSNKVDMAVMRADEAVARQTTSIAVLLKETLFLNVNVGSRVKSWNNLKGQRIGMLGRFDEQDPFLKAMLKAHGAENATLVKLSAPQLHEQIIAQKLQGFIALAPLHQGFAEMAMKINPMKQSAHPFKVIAMEDTENRAALDKRYQEAEIPAGVIRDSPPLPIEAVSSLSVNRHLFVTRSLPNRYVSLFINDLFDAKRALVRDNPLFNLVQAPDLETDAHVKVHAGASLYYNNEETSFSDLFKEQLYLIPMILGAIGSLIVWLTHFLNPAKQHQNSSTLLEIIDLTKQVKMAENMETLTPMKEQFDKIYRNFIHRVDKNEVTDDVAFPLIEAFEGLNKRLEKRLAKFSKA